MSAAPKDVTISTTLPRSPFLLSAFRPPILTSRLLLRPLTPWDLPAALELRRQPEVMRWTSKGSVDSDHAETESWLNRFLSPNDETTYNFAICLQERPAEMVGVGGCHVCPGEDAPLGWPEFGYMLRQEVWGAGLASEFVRAFLRAWWDLPRVRVELRVPWDSVVMTGEEEGGKGKPVRAVELLLGQVDARNGASRSILEKNGFEAFRSWHARDLDLMYYRLRRSSADL